MKKAETVATATQETEVKDVTSTVNNATAATAIKDAEKVVKAAKAPKPRKPNVEIVSAFYGIEGTEVDFKATCKIGQKLTNKMVTTDPVPKKVKRARIIIKIEGKEQEEVTINEGEKIVSENWDLTPIVDAVPEVAPEAPAATTEEATTAPEAPATPEA